MHDGSETQSQHVITAFMWLLNSSVTLADSCAIRLSNVSLAHNICHAVNASADRFRTAPIVLHLTSHHAY